MEQRTCQRTGLARNQLTSDRCIANGIEKRTCNRTGLAAVPLSRNVSKQNSQQAPFGDVAWSQFPNEVQWTVLCRLELNGS